MPSYLSFAVTFLALLLPVSGFSTALFQEQASKQFTATSDTKGGVEIELPNFDELFNRISQVSPLARLSLEGGEVNGKRGLAGISDALSNTFNWKTIESNKNGHVQRIDKIDRFQGLPAPLLRFRSNLKGPCVADCFTNFLTTFDYRSKWDPSIAQVYERFPILDLDTVNKAMGFGKYGDCTQIGVGYCQTKPSFGVDSREQLTMCGIQELKDGSSIIWGTEMEERHNHLLPEGKRYTRAKSHLFSTSLVPLNDGSFDVEYCLQIEIGGNLPNWITTPIVVDNVKNMFKTCAAFFSEGEGGALDKYLKEMESMQCRLDDSRSLLMTF